MTDMPERIFATREHGSRWCTNKLSKDFVEYSRADLADLEQEGSHAVIAALMQDKARLEGEVGRLREALERVAEINGQCATPFAASEGLAISAKIARAALSGEGGGC